MSDNTRDDDLRQDRSRAGPPKTIVCGGPVAVQGQAHNTPKNGPPKPPAGTFCAETVRSTFSARPGRNMYRPTFVLPSVPSLLARHLEKRLRWQEMFAPLLSARLPAEGDRDLHAHAIVASALSCLDAESRAWVQSDRHAELPDLYDQAVHAVRR